jgi:hypothetical protein
MQRVKTVLKTTFFKQTNFATTALFTLMNAPSARTRLTVQTAITATLWTIITPAPTAMCLWIIASTVLLVTYVSTAVSVSIRTTLNVCCANCKWLNVWIASILLSVCNAQAILSLWMALVYADTVIWWLKFATLFWDVWATIISVEWKDAWPAMLEPISLILILTVLASSDIQ